MNNDLFHDKFGSFRPQEAALSKLEGENLHFQASSIAYIHDAYEGEEGKESIPNFAKEFLLVAFPIFLMRRIEELHWQEKKSMHIDDIRELFKLVIEDLVETAKEFKKDSLVVSNLDVEKLIDSFNICLEFALVKVVNLRQLYFNIGEVHARTTEEDEILKETIRSQEEVFRSIVKLFQVNIDEIDKQRSTTIQPDFGRRYSLRKKGEQAQKFFDEVQDEFNA